MTSGTLSTVRIAVLLRPKFLCVPDVLLDPLRCFLNSSDLVLVEDSPLDFEVMSFCVEDLPVGVVD
ncbi:hypothetical protein NW762_002912 [Fusarium torreyae]|uniref:Uncharacterized protein n=1 Tax=Fusarium torreyae TaxID=1237075 RepID=A0A9W8SAP8_9HYPO|nr:hypothetical protein NW762_002912 [Fusarium torreyae]